MGDLVYNNYTPKIYARAKVFKLMNGERLVQAILFEKRVPVTVLNAIFKCALEMEVVGIALT